MMLEKEAKSLHYMRTMHQQAAGKEYRAQAGPMFTWTWYFIEVALLI